MTLKDFYESLEKFECDYRKWKSGKHGSKAAGLRIRKFLTEVKKNASKMKRETMKENTEFYP